MDYQQLHSLRRSHPAWKLLAADHAPLIIGFLYHSFIQPNTCRLAEQELATRRSNPPSASRYWSKAMKTSPPTPCSGTPLP